MNNSTQVELSVATSNKGFSFDGFVFTSREPMTSRGMSGIVELVLEFINEYLCVLTCREHEICQSPKCCEDPTHPKTIGEIPVPEFAAHRWVVQSDCDMIGTGSEIFGVLCADGTGYKRVIREVGR